MSNGALVKSVFDLPPSKCYVSDYYIGSDEVGLKEIGKSIQEIFPNKLYSYQLEAIGTVLKGNDCFLAVGTGSGKSEAFLFPILEEVINGKINCAIIIYPTKQLAEDQEKRIAKYCNKIHEATGKKITYSRYNGDLKRKEIEFIEKSKPNIILATIDKLFYRFFKESNNDFLDWLLNAGAFVVDEIHAGSGGYLAHVREIIAIFKRINPKLRVILASATVKEVETFRDKFLPSAQIITGNATRGSVRVMLLQPESIEDLLLEKIDPYLRKVKGVCVIFVDDIRKVGELVAKCNELLKKKTNIPDEILKIHSPFACINSQLNNKEKTSILKGIYNGTIRFLFATSLLELGMNIPNIVHIINISWPITGTNGLLQRLGRLRFLDTSEKKNFTLVLNPERTIDDYYLNHPGKIEDILLENKSERILFDSKASGAQAFVLLRLVLGVTKIEDILSQCTDELDYEITQTAISLLFARGLLSTENHHIPYLERTLVIADRNEVNNFVRKHRIRSTESQWEIIQKNSKHQVEKIVSIDEQRIIFSALPGNLLHLGSKGDVFRVKKLIDNKFLVEKLSINQTNIVRNKLKPPLFIIEGQSRVQQIEHLSIRFGKMIIRWETNEIMNYSRDGSLIESQIKTSTHEKISANIGKGNEKLRNHIWDEKTSGLLIELADISRFLPKELKKQVVKLFKELLVKSIELELHISESSFRIYMNFQENKIVLYDRGGELGNAEAVFTQIKRVLKQMLNLLLETATDSQNLLINNVPDKSIDITRKMIEEMVKDNA
ncbi:MAG: DEAD/DEAH box helicase [Candidatus Heimdallarchaeota archaeon]